MEKNPLRNKVGAMLVGNGLLSKLIAIQAFSEKNTDITPEQFLILSVLVEEGEMYQRQISEFTIKPRSNVTRIINILEKAGYVKRIQGSNKRMINKIIVTPQGNEEYKKLSPIIEEISKKTIENIDDDSLKIFVNVLEQIQENLRKNVTLQI